ncbi:UNVERIFIED_CONTAM: hypothetical protein RMT77_013480 [Armadillidium vulgare]
MVVSVAEDLPGYGVQYERLTFKDNWDWFIHVQDPRDVFLAQPTYLISEFIFYTLGILTLIHSFLVGGRWKYFWLGTLIHGLTTESLSFFLPDIDNYWHSQTSVMLLGRRLPLHIAFLYPAFMYNAAYMVAHLKLAKWVQPMAAGLVEVLMDIPYDIMAIKFIHWTWHDTDPNIFDRHYWVPWTSYYFHLTFGTSFNFFLNFWRRTITGSDEDGRVSSVGKEILCAVLAGLCGMPGGVLQFIVLYHPLHDMLGIHTENCVFLIIAFYFLLVWEADRSSPTGSRRQKGDKTHWSVGLLVLGLLLHYSLYLGMAVFGHPEREVSMGLHEKPGNCSQISDVQTAFGLTLKKRTYLCLKDYDEKYFDFHCLKSPPKNGVEWYTICGTPFENREEYSTMILGITVTAIFIYYNLLFRSAPTIKYGPSKAEKKLKTK